MLRNTSNTRRISREGFTLVELLIVIVVIGVLSAMMMLSSTEAVSSARANNIVSNLRNLKTATLAWYADNLDKTNNMEKGLEESNDDIQHYFNKHPEYLKKYLGNDEFNLNKSIKDADGCALKAGDYGIMNDTEKIGGTRNNRWYVATLVGDEKVQEKLKAKAKSVGLLKSNNKEAGDYDGGRVVYMHVLSLAD